MTGKRHASRSQNRVPRSPIRHVRHPKDVSAGLNQIMVLGAALFLTLGFYDLFEVIGFSIFTDPGPKTLEYLSFAIGSLFGGVLYHTLGVRIMAFLGAFFYGINVAVIRLAHINKNSTLLELLSGAITGAAASWYWVTAGVAIASYSAPKHRLWFFAMFWSLFYSSNTIASIVELSTEDPVEGELLVKQWVVDFLGAVMIGSSLMSSLLLNEPQFLRRSDNLWVQITSRPMGFQGIRRVWSIPRKTPGFLWLVPWLLFSDFGANYASQMVFYDDPNGTLVGFRHLLFNTTQLVTPILIAAFNNPLPIKEICASFGKALCINFQPFWSRPDGCYSDTPDSQSLSPTSVSSPSPSPSDLHSLKHAANVSREETDINYGEGLVGKKQNDPTFHITATKMVYGYSIAMGVTNVLGLAVHWFISKESTAFSLVITIYLALRGTCVVVRKAFCYWVIGYYCGNSVSLASFYISFFKTLQAVGTAISWSFYLVNHPHTISFVSNLVGFIISVICALKAISIMSTDFTPPYKIREKPTIALFDRLDQVRAPLQRQGRNDENTFADHCHKELSAVHVQGSVIISGRNVSENYHDASVELDHHVRGALIAVQDITDLRHSIRGHRASSTNVSASSASRPTQNVSSPLKSPNGTPINNRICVVFLPQHDKLAAGLS